MDDLKPGARVHHDTFGDGTVLQATDQHITIHFDTAGRKKLATALAVLSAASTTDPAAARRGTGRAWPPASARNLPAEARAAQPSTAAAAASGPPAPSTIEALIDLARRKVGSEESLNAFVSTMRGVLPWSGHQHVGTLSGMRVVQFQNWMLDENPNWQLTDAQILAVMRVEFPMAVGVVHTGDADAGLSQIAGIRAHYNRDGHGGPSPIERGMPYSVSYGRY